MKMVQLLLRNVGFTFCVVVAMTVITWVVFTIPLVMQSQDREVVSYNNGVKRTDVVRPTEGDLNPGYALRNNAVGSVGIASFICAQSTFVLFHLKSKSSPR